MIEWRSIPGYTGSYEASNTGLIRSLDRLVRVKGGHRSAVGQILKPSIKNGYECVVLAKKCFTVHCLVALTFIGSRPTSFDVCHTDGNKRNNAITNLRYDSRLNNIREKHIHGTMAKGSKINTSRLSEAQVVDMRIRFAAGETQLSLAREFGISSAGCSHIIRGKNWPSAPGPTRPAEKRKSPRFKK